MSDFAEEVSLVPCPHCGVETRLSLPTPPPSPTQQLSKPIRTKLAELTEESIRSSTKSGDTPLHRAAKNGTIREIPRRLLQKELFLAKNGAGKTPLHIAAESGSLDQVPSEFLTKETLTIRTEPHYASGGAYTTGSGYRARTETVLHVAVRCGHADQIPKEFFTPEFLSIEASGYRLTLLHDLACADRLDLVPEMFANSEIWGMQDYVGRTPRDVLEESNARENYVTAVRSEPVTEKQKEKLRFFGYTLREGMTKGEASDAIDECVRRSPQRDAEYYGRPATEEQLEKIRELNEESVRIDGEPAYELETLTYGEAKDIIQENEWARRKEAEEEEMNKFSNPPSKAQLAWLRESGIKLDSSAKVTEWELEYIVGLEKSPPREEDLSLFKQHGIISFEADGFGAYLFADLIRSFGGSAQDHNRSNINYGPPCQAALRDPAYQKPTLTYNEWEHCVEFSWPKSKIKEWLRA